jgi:Family of unknown function (DUF5871)
MAVMHVNDFSADLITFSDVRKNKLGGKTVYINTPSSAKILLQLPPLRAPFGLSIFTDSKTGQSSYSLPLSLDDPSVLEKFKAIDEKVFKYVSENSEAILGKKYSPELIREGLYKPIITPSKGDYAPTLKLKVQVDRNGSFLPEAYDHMRNTIQFDALSTGDKVHSIVDLSQIWVIDNKCGVSMRVQQIMKVPSSNLKGFAFQVQEENDEEIDIAAAED